MTQLLVLGLLKREPMSGYDIQMMLQTSDAESWGGVLPGSIYHALKKLEQGGFIEVAAIEQTGRRQKAVYRITEPGVRQFEQLVYGALQTCSVAFPTVLYSGLNFLEDIGSEQVIRALAQQKDALERDRDRLMHGKAAKQAAMGGVLAPISEVVFDHMTETIGRQMELIDRVMAQLV